MERGGGRQSRVSPARSPGVQRTRACRQEREAEPLRGQGSEDKERRGRGSEREQCRRLPPPRRSSAAHQRTQSTPAHLSRRPHEAPTNSPRLTTTPPLRPHRSTREPSRQLRSPPLRDAPARLQLLTNQSATRLSSRRPPPRLVTPPRSHRPPRADRGMSHDRREPARQASGSSRSATPVPGPASPAASSSKARTRESSAAGGYGAHGVARASPSKKRVYGDRYGRVLTLLSIRVGIDSLALRFIPNRDGLDLATSFTLLPGSASSSNSSTPSASHKGKRRAAGEGDAQTGE